MITALVISLKFKRTLLNALELSRIPQYIAINIKKCIKKGMVTVRVY